MSRSDCNPWTAWITTASIALMFLLMSARSFGQSSGTIKGIVKDQSGEVELANVVLTEAVDTAEIINVAVNDSLCKL